METIVITGASGDIGSAVALQLAKHGVRLALIGHTSTDQLREYQDVRFEDLRAITDQL